MQGGAILSTCLLLYQNLSVGKFKKLILFLWWHKKARLTIWLNSANKRVSNKDRQKKERKRKKKKKADKWRVRKKDLAERYCTVGLMLVWFVYMSKNVLTVNSELKLSHSWKASCKKCSIKSLRKIFLLSIQGRDCQVRPFEIWSYVQQCTGNNPLHRNNTVSKSRTAELPWNEVSLIH